VGHAQDLWRNGSVSFSAGSVDDFLRAAFRCDYTAFYTKSYRIDHTAEYPLRSGSQLWHADGGPGTCIIVMRYDSNVTADDGPLEVINWKRSVEIFAKEPRHASRDALCAYYESQIRPGDRTTYIGPKNTVIAFLNNAIHRGGYPGPGHSRDATVTHYYPSLRGEKITKAKVESYPKDPDI
jgi:hypothetical protein